MRLKGKIKPAERLKLPLGEKKSWESKGSRLMWKRSKQENRMEAESEVVGSDEKCDSLRD